MKTPMKSAKRIVAIVFAFSICAIASATALAGVFGTPAKVPEVEKGANAIVVDGKTLYCGASDTLYVFDISGAPTALRLLSKLSGFCGIRQMAIDGGLLAASARRGSVARGCLQPRRAAPHLALRERRAGHRHRTCRELHGHWRALVKKLDEYAYLKDVGIGTAKKNDRAWYIGRPREAGDPHGQAAMSWICGALMEK